MYCKNCKEEIANARFCPHCGEDNELYEISEENPVEKFNLVTAYKSMFLRYADFSGRSRRSEYWYAYLANYIIVLALGLIMMAFSNSEVMATIFGILIFLYSLIIIVPALALSFRRLHDTGRSAWWLLIGLIPSIGELIIFIFMLLDSKPGENKYGKNPKGE